MSTRQVALTAYRRQRLAQVLDRHSAPDSPELEEVPLAYINAEGEGSGPVPTYAAVVQHEGDGDYAIGLFNRQHEAHNFLLADYPEWEPYALYHLGTGESLGFRVESKIVRSNDRAMGDLTP